MQAVATSWDAYSYLSPRNSDFWLDTADLMLYMGIALVISAVLWGLRVKPSLRPFISPIQFANTAGLKLASLGSLMQIIARALSESIHLPLAAGPVVALVRALLTVGTLTVCLGMIVGLSIELGMIGQRILIASTLRRCAVQFCIVLIFASMWLTAAGSLIHIALSLREPSLKVVVTVLLAILPPLVFVPAKRVLPVVGSVLAIGIFFYGVAYWFLVGNGEASNFIPLGILYVAAFDLLVDSLRRRFTFARSVMIASAGTSVMFYATYYPFTRYLFPWTVMPSVWLVPLVAGSILGTFLGLRVYSGLSSMLLADARKSRL